MSARCGVVLPFPRVLGVRADHDRRFLLDTARLIDALAGDTSTPHSLLHLYAAVDLRRPRMRRLLADSATALTALERVSERAGLRPADAREQATQLAAALEVLVRSDRAPETS